MAEYRRLREKWLKAEGDVLPNGCEQPRVALSSEKEIAKAWATVEPCLDSFRSIIMDMTECINILSEGRKYNAAISPQLLYETIIHVRNATILFSVYEENMGTINKAMIKMETQKRRKTRLRINVALVVIFVAVTAGWFTGGLSTLVFAATGGAAAGGSAANEVSYCLDISKHKELIRQFDASISKLGKALGEANYALTAIYCSQVLKMPLDSEHITAHDRNVILRCLGLDVDRFQCREYSGGVVKSRIKRLCHAYKGFKDKSQQVKDAANVRARRIHTGKLISTQQLMRAE
ncbi:hypothetical protein E5D57_011967 [Metarhizium anisopliae]|nr:hypothetical protein E5D57_011967 [Metarhizium anisopliae]